MNIKVKTSYSNSGVKEGHVPSSNASKASYGLNDNNLLRQ